MLEITKLLSNFLQPLFERECFIANLVGILKVCFWYLRHQPNQTDRKIYVRRLSNISLELGFMKVLTNFLGSSVGSRGASLQE